MYVHFLLHRKFGISLALMKRVSKGLIDCTLQSETSVIYIFDLEYDFHGWQGKINKIIIDLNKKGKDQVLISPVTIKKEVFLKCFIDLGI